MLVEENILFLVIFIGNEYVTRHLFVIICLMNGKELPKNVSMTVEALVYSLNKNEFNPPRESYEVGKVISKLSQNWDSLGFPQNPKPWVMAVILR